MLTIHQHYRIAYEATLAAQLISLQARLQAVMVFTHNTDLFIERQLLNSQIIAVQAEITRLDTEG